MTSNDAQNIKLNQFYILAVAIKLKILLATSTVENENQQKTSFD